MSGAPEIPMVVSCRGSALLGVLHRGSREAANTGVLILVGGPQYRVGSHRQFVLMARALAAAGYPVLRFDYRGCGDSEGDFGGFEAVEEDVRVAVDALVAAVPGLENVVLWGLCDAASAALLYCRGDRRVRGVVIANPWVRSEAGEARAYLRHYYGGRLLQASFWRKVLMGRFRLLESLRGLVRSMRKATRRGEKAQPAAAPFVERMRAGVERFDGPILCLISERDLTAKEFEDLIGVDPAWRRAMSKPNVSIVRLAGADHTFSARDALDRAIGLSLGLLRSRGANGSTVAQETACR